ERPSTSASGSQPSDNTKKDKISRPPCSILKNKCNGCMLSDNHDLCVLNSINDVNTRVKSKSVKKNSKRKRNVCPLTRITTTAEVPPRKPIALESDTPKPVVTLVYSRKPRKSKTTDPVSKPKIIKSANNKEPSKSWGSTVFDVPSSSLDECRSSKLFSGQSVCSACAMGKSKKKPHKLKSEDTNQEKVYLLHMDLYGPMCVTSVNEKKYILVTVNDYSRFTWAHVRRIRTDNGTKFVNQTLREYYKKVDISHETSVSRSPQQNGVVERRNRTLIEAARTIVDLPAPESIILIAKVVAPELVVSTGSPSSTTIDQDAPCSSTSQTSPETQSPAISNIVEEENHDLDVVHMNNNLFFSILIPEHDSEASYSSDVIPTIVHIAAPNSEHVSKWTKDHPLENIIVEPKNYKDALTQAWWIEAMQEEVNEFEHRIMRRTLCYNL
ncbi:retrovirus-related pol polyprotein from transposon TNT 1-94, partial [Tanacetum coccineum]